MSKCIHKKGDACHFGKELKSATEALLAVHGLLIQDEISWPDRVAAIHDVVVDWFEETYEIEVVERLQ
jgi:hypothetical protein